MLAFKKNSTHLNSNQTKLSLVSESSTHLLQNYICMLFSAYLQARKLCPQTYSLSLCLEWSQVIHTPASIKSGRAYKPEKSALYSIFARQLCDDTILPGWLSAFQYSHEHSSSLRQALHTQIANHPYKFFFFFFKCCTISFKVPLSHMKVPQATWKEHAPLLIPVAAMGKCKLPKVFHLCHYGHPTLLINREQNLPDLWFKVVLA